MLGRLGRLGKVGDCVAVEGAQLGVESMDGLRIASVSLTPTPSAKGQASVKETDE
jgi:hypothetical protein